MIADEQIGIFVHATTVTAAHLRGRKADGKPTELFGRTWRVSEIREVEGRLLVMLRPLPRDGAEPIMCGRCGSFEWDQPGGSMGPFECSSCPHRGAGNGVLF